MPNSKINFRRARLGEERIFRHRLKNGLTVILLEDNSLPIVAVDIWYKVGSKNEVPGKSGFAHLFEHMMFEGSANVGKAQHMKLVNDVGGTINGSTSHDRTNYWQVVPSNQLELVLWLESDRMRSLDLSPENFENQRSTVKEERRQRIDNQPYVPVLFELKDELAFELFPYKHSLIGSMEELDAAVLEDVRRFHDTYYKPNNAILTVVGDIKVEDALELVQRYFEDIPAGEPVPQVVVAEPIQNSEKRLRFDDPFAPFPAYIAAFHTPGRTDSDYYVLECIEKILFDGESSWLYHRLVEEQQIALHLVGGGDGKFDASLFFLFAQLHPGNKLADLEMGIETVLARLREDRMDERVLKKAKNKLKAEYISRQETVRERADLLCMYEMLFNDPEMVHKELDKFMAVSSDDIRRVANRYLTRKNCSTIEVYPGGQNS